jgi:hypothetical protein
VEGSYSRTLAVASREPNGHSLATMMFPLAARVRSSGLSSGSWTRWDVRSAPPLAEHGDPSRVERDPSVPIGS